jgi:glutamate/tyrosine decarboxylase-like PLP-dependent enzyme
MIAQSRFSKISHSFLESLEKHYQTLPEERKMSLEGNGSDESGAWFLGTRGQNAGIFTDLVIQAIQKHIEFRNSYFPEDPTFITPEMQESKEFKESIALLQYEYEKLLRNLQDSGPFFSMRSIGHMLWDVTMPSLLGYFAALLYNQNNVAAEASPVTTVLEMLVGNDLCKMLGFKVQKIVIHGQSEATDKTKITGWGHITCDGSVANAEGLWMARNLKFYAVSLKNAILNEPTLAPLKALQITTLQGETEPIIKADNWTLLNLGIDYVLSLPQLIQEQYGIATQTLGNLVNNYSVQTLGLLALYKKYLRDIDNPPVGFSPVTRHYSWPKGAAILGIGAENLRTIQVDGRARMKADELDKALADCLATQTPVMTVVVVVGTTEESAVDPLVEVLALREKYRKQGMEFTVHVDAAWGGYFASMLRKKAIDQNFSDVMEDIDDSFIPSLPMSEYVIAQYKAFSHADSITVDPHKAGYIPYPAGGLCYRNSAMRNLVAFTAPVVYHGGFDPTVGIYGIEGSKPGAAAAAVYLSHRVIRPDQSGYGKILSECYFTAKRFYATLCCLNLKEYPFIFVPLVPTPAEQAGESKEDIIKQLVFMQERIVKPNNEEIVQDAEAMALVKELGQDQTIVTYMFNFKNRDGSVNTDTKKMSDLNFALYQKLSFSPGETDLASTPLVVTASEFDPNVYGADFMENIRVRLGVMGDEQLPINFIISTVMNPWLTATTDGSFLTTFADILAQTVTELVHEIWNKK